MYSSKTCVLMMARLALLDSDSFPSMVIFYEYLQYRSTITLERKPLTDADFSPDSPPDEPMTPFMFDLEVSRKLTVSDVRFRPKLSFLKFWIVDK